MESQIYAYNADTSTCIESQINAYNAGTQTCKESQVHGYNARTQICKKIQPELAEQDRVTMYTLLIFWTKI